jgi:hypothetical protein
MKPIHKAMARIGLAVLEPYGFVLAGGYAVAVCGAGERPSDDLDLFTNLFDVQNFAKAKQALVAAFNTAGFAVTVDLDTPLFCRFTVQNNETMEASKLEIGYDYRRFPPLSFELGHVLDLRDSAAAKMLCIYDRQAARDYVDIFNLVTSGQFSCAELIAQADQHGAEPMDRHILAHGMRQVASFTPEEFEQYGVSRVNFELIVRFFTQWALQVENTLRTGQAMMELSETVSQPPVWSFPSTVNPPVAGIS